MEVTNQMRNLVQDKFYLFLTGELDHREFVNQLSIVTGKTLTRIQKELVEEFASDAAYGLMYSFLQCIDDNEDDTN